MITKYKVKPNAADMVEAFAVTETRWAKGFSYCNDVLMIWFEDDWQEGGEMLRRWAEGMDEIK